MPEQLIQPQTEAAPPALLSDPSAVSAPRDPSSEALRQATSCLASADRRLKKGRPEQTDEILNLLWAATLHLQQAVKPARTRIEGGVPLSGAE
jgi:hypothetical protein